MKIDDISVFFFAEQLTVEWKVMFFTWNAVVFLSGWFHWNSFENEKIKIAAVYVERFLCYYLINSTIKHT